MRLVDWIPLGAVPSVECNLLARRLASRDPPQIVDVRTRAEFEAGRIAGARSAPIVALPSLLEALALDPARPVVAICLSAHRSIPAVRLLRERGFADVAQLEGGMLAWRRAGLPEERG